MNEDNDSEVHPRTARDLFGHSAAEQTLLRAYQSGRMPHAWLIGGRLGIGKATLAYRVARFVLAHPDPASAEVQNATSLAVPPDHPAATRIAAQAHPNLLVLERTLNDKGKLRQDIAVDDVRRAVPFFGSTAAEAGWRVAIIDKVDELNRAGANALLKVLEEPPKHSLFLLVSEAGGRVLPTIRSRCRQLPLRPLEAEDIRRVLATFGELDATPEQIGEAVAAAEGSVSAALALLDGSALALRRQVVALLDRLPATDPRGLHLLADALTGADTAPLALFMDTVNRWLADRLPADARHSGRAARTAKTYEAVNRAAQEAEAYNLERRPLVFNVFGLLAETARG